MGEAIPIGARIMAVVDVYDALRTARPYKRPLGHAQAVEVLEREVKAGYWDSRIVAVFLGMLGDAGPPEPGAGRVDAA